jgi:hypothetical protein
MPLAHLFSEADFMHHGLAMQEQKLSAEPRAFQVAICVWIIVSVVWYFYQFSPAFIPIIQPLLHRWH